MITTKVILRTDKKRKDNKCPLFIRITKSRTHAYINVGLYVEEKLWNTEKQKLRTSYPNSIRANNYLSSLLSKIELTALDFITKDKFFNSKMIKEIVLNKNNNDLIEFSKEWITQRKNSKTINYTTQIKYEGIIDKLEVFCKGKLPLSDFTTAFIKKYEFYLRNTIKNKTNTISSNLSCLRAITNGLIKEKIIKVDDNPFLGYNFQFEKTRRKHLLPEQIKKILRVRVDKNSKAYDCKLIFLFCLETGLRIGDALHLKKDSFDGSHLKYVCQKTKSPETLLLTLKAKRILTSQCYRNKNTKYVFNFLNQAKQALGERDSLNDQKSATALINKYLKIIAKKAKLKTELSTHFARHSMATNAISKGLSFEEIKAILGHSDVKTTQRYAKVIDLVKDKAIKKLN